MIITRTPYRMSFLGGGTDYGEWYREHGGAVLTTTIDHYCYLAVRRMPPLLGVRYRVVWSMLENVNEREKIEHPGVRGCLEYLGMDEGLEISHAGDLPARSGLGSSSAFTVGLLAALHALRGERPEHARLADEAIRVEQEVLKETVGIQDQIQCAHGGLNFIEIRPDGSYGVFPLVLPEKRVAALQAHLLLFFTGIVRHASGIAKVQVANARHRVDQMSRIGHMATEGWSILQKGLPIEKFGELLHEGWILKRGMSHLVTNDTVDVAYAKAMAAGAIGGKLLGAGGGGFMLIFARPADHEKIREALRPMLDIPVRFDGGGAQIIHSS